jgi:hypothetical protein
MKSEFEILMSSLEMVSKVAHKGYYTIHKHPDGYKIILGNMNSAETPTIWNMPGFESLKDALIDKERNFGK